MIRTVITQPERSAVQDRTVPRVRVGCRELGADRPAYIVAEIGLNHCGRRDRAIALIESAAAAGADAVKFQKRSARALLTAEGYCKPYTNGGNSYGSTYGEHREALELGEADFRALLVAADRCGVDLFASAWDLPSVAFLDRMDPPAVKVASADLTNSILLDAVAALGRPVFLSTGMSRPEEIDHAVARLVRKIPLVLCHCVSLYPTPPEEARLGTLTRFRERYRVPVGYTGHEMDWTVALAARTLGACVIEKHFTLDQTWKGGDHKVSLLPEEFGEMVSGVRTVEKAIAGARSGLVDGELPQRRKLAKSLVAREPIRAGRILQESMLLAKSPALGIGVQHLSRLVGRTVLRDIAEDAYILESDLGGVGSGKNGAL